MQGSQYFDGTIIFTVTKKDRRIVPQDGNVFSIGVTGRSRCSQMKTDPAILHSIMHNSVMQEKT